MVRIPLRNKAGKVVAYATVDDADAEWANQYKWHRHIAGYAARNLSHRLGLRGQILMHRELLGLKKGDRRTGDHINFDRLDNRRSNLRVVTFQQNLQHQQMRKENTSGYRGVSWCKPNKKWCVFVKVNNKSRYFGSFDDVHEAGRVAEETRARLGYLV